MPGRDIIVIGASAGGVEALRQLVSGFPADFPASVFIVLHVSPYHTSMLPSILMRVGRLPALHPEGDEKIKTGQIYIAPPDHHLLLYRERIHISHGPSENGHRPAVDPLFRSAAQVYGKRVIGVVLSGALDDGTAGLIAVKQRGGITIVQDPEEALYPGMPQSAIENAPVDHVLRVPQIADLLSRLIAEEVEGGETPMPDEMEIEAEIADFDKDALQSDQRPGTPSGFTCPECHGALWEIQDGDLIRFRCRVGHAYSADSLLAEQSEALEGAMWTAYRALKESAALAHRLATRARARGHTLASERFQLQQEDALRRADIIRRVLLRGELSAGQLGVGETVVSD